MENKTIIGIDISCKTLDLCIRVNGTTNYTVIKNDVKSIHKYFKQYNVSELVVAMENTGRYNWNLFQIMEQLNIRAYVISPLHLKKSIGLVRGKNDKIDALRICSFIEKNMQDIPQWKPSAKEITKLKILITERNSRIKIKRKLVTQQQDYKLMKGFEIDKKLIDLNKKLIKSIEGQIKEIEIQIEDTINMNTELSKQAELIKSVPGVGKVLSWLLISKTDGFTTINCPRKLACYSGVVPFENQSGTSIYRKPRVSIFADKNMKSTLHLAAMSAIQNNEELKKYYKRKVEEGKNKMLVINAVRNKIIHRVFAVIKRQKPYEINLVLS